MTVTVRLVGGRGGWRGSGGGHARVELTDDDDVVEYGECKTAVCHWSVGTSRNTAHNVTC